MSIFLENDKMISVHFESIVDLLGFDFDSVPHGVEAKSYITTHGHSRGKSWFGIDGNAEDVINGGLIGDLELMEELEEKIEVLRKIESSHFVGFTQKINETKRKRVFEDQGDELDIEKVYNGQLDTAWSKTVRVNESAHKNLVTIMIDINGNAMMDARDSLWRSAVSVVLAEKLQAAGKSVKIMVGTALTNVFTNSKKAHTNSCVIKNYNESLSMSRLAAMTHLGWFRTFGFASVAMTQYKPRGNLGYCMHMKEHDWLMPIGIQQEIKAGHTQVAIVDWAMSYRQAEEQLINIYKELSE